VVYECLLFLSILSKEELPYSSVASTHALGFFFFIDPPVHHEIDYYSSGPRVCLSLRPFKAYEEVCRPAHPESPTLFFPSDLFFWVRLALPTDFQR